MADSPLALLDAAFHVAAGPKPADERGLDGRVKLLQRGTKWIAVLTLNTQAGPVCLAASADEQVVVRLLAMACKQGQGEMPASLQSAARRIAQSVAKEGVMAKVGDGWGADAEGVWTVAGDSKEEAAARLYTRMTQRDPTAWAAVQKILTQVRQRDPKAVAAYRLILQVHARRKMLGWDAATKAQKDAGARIYKKLLKSDAGAWGVLSKIAAGAQAGDLKCQQAWGILGRIHDELRTRRNQGMSISGVGLSTTRKNFLVQKARDARMFLPGQFKFILPAAIATTQAPFFATKLLNFHAASLPVVPAKPTLKPIPLQFFSAMKF